MKAHDVARGGSITHMCCSLLNLELTDGTAAATITYVASALPTLLTPILVGSRHGSGEKGANPYRRKPYRSYIYEYALTEFRSPLSNSTTNSTCSTH
jgi:hypothetical protein